MNEHDDPGHDPAGRATRRLKNQQNEHRTEDQVPAIGRRVAIPEVVTAHEQIHYGRHTEQRENDIPRHQAIAKAARDREQQKDQQQHEADMNRPQYLRLHDPHCRVHVEQRHCDEEDRRQAGKPAAISADRTFILLDVLLRLAQGFVGNLWLYSHCNRLSCVAHSSTFAPCAPVCALGAARRAHLRPWLIASIGLDPSLDLDAMLLEVFLGAWVEWQWR